MVIQNLGVSSLAGVLQNRVKDVSCKPSVVDLGEIQEDGSLLCNQFPCPIPKSDYMVCRSVILGGAYDILSQTQEIGLDFSGSHSHEILGNGGHSHENSITDGHSHNISQESEHNHSMAEHFGHLHDVLLGKKLRGLEAGDRVLVVWTDSKEVCVVDLIFKADSTEVERFG